MFSSQVRASVRFGHKKSDPREIGASRAAAAIRLDVNVYVMGRSLTALEHSGVKEKFSFQLLSLG